MMNKHARGVVAQNLSTMEIKSFPADAVIMATGGPGIIFGKSTNSMINTGSAASIVYQQGANLCKWRIYSNSSNCYSWR